MCPQRRARRSRSTTRLPKSTSSSLHWAKRVACSCNAFYAVFSTLGSALVMDLKDLYRDVIVDHNRHPRNFGKLEPSDAHADGHNPLCGDRLTVYANLDGDRLSEVKFEGAGCAISVASASL